MFRNNIQQRVIEHARKKAAEGQKEYNEFADQANTELLENISSLQDAHRRTKQTKEEEIVGKIINQ